MTEPAATPAFDDFFAANFSRLVRAAFLLTGNAGEAEDLAQEAMARVFVRWDRVAGMDSPEGYVYRTALNLYRKRLRRLAVRARVGPSAPAQADAVAAADDRLAILRALRALTREQREAVVLVDWAGFSAEDASKLLGVEGVSVRGRVQRARAALREELGGER